MFSRSLLQGSKGARRDQQPRCVDLIEASWSKFNSRTPSPVIRQRGHFALSAILARRPYNLKRSHPQTLAAALSSIITGPWLPSVIAADHRLPVIGYMSAAFK